MWLAGLSPLDEFTHFRARRGLGARRSYSKRPTRCDLRCMLERLLVQRSDHGALTLVHVYRAALQQARLLAHVWEDPHLYTAHRYLVRVSAETLLETRPFSRLRPTSRPKTVAFRSLSIDTQRRWARCIKQVRNLANANAGWPHAVTRALDQAYARRGKLRHELMQVRYRPYERSCLPPVAPAAASLPSGWRECPIPPAAAHAGAAACA